MKYNRIFLIVLDSLGVGAMKDALDYGDTNPHTLDSVLKAKDELKINNLIKLGFTNLSSITKYHNQNHIGYVTKLEEESLGKDTMTGHWEFMGVKTTKPFVTFTDHGFPDELIRQLEERTGRKVVGNKAASGTDIIVEYGEHQMKTGDLIVYTSADSVLQIAAHEDIIPLDELYRYCEIAREITMKEEWLLGRIIARPFNGEIGDFKRTSNRHDYALKPPHKTTLDHLKDNGYDVISVGKINDIFDSEGITKAYKSKSNEDGMDITLNIMKNEDFKGLCFVNLVDFDANYGHRRDPIGYASCLESFDKQLGEVLNNLREDDLLMLVADHGNDPCHSGTDHTREYIPFVTYSHKLTKVIHEQSHYSFACVGAIIADNFNVELPKIGHVIEF